MPLSGEDNPLRLPLMALLREHPEGCSEWQLIEALRARGEVQESASGDADLALFRLHFLVMNALYRLQQDFSGEGFFLQVSPLCIRLHAAREGGSSLAAVDETPPSVREYYLDEENLRNTCGDDVRGMLRGFWERYLREDQRPRAYEVLGIPTDAGVDEIRTAYRRLAAEHHPDRGGDPARFMEIREAWEVLSPKALSEP